MEDQKAVTVPYTARAVAATVLRVHMAVLALRVVTVPAAVWTVIRAQPVSRQTAWY